MHFFKEFHDMNWEKFWILAELALNDPIIDGFQSQPILITSITAPTEPQLFNLSAGAAFKTATLV